MTPMLWLPDSMAIVGDWLLVERAREQHDD